MNGIQDSQNIRLESPVIQINLQIDLKDIPSQSLNLSLPLGQHAQHRRHRAGALLGERGARQGHPLSVHHHGAGMMS